MSAMWEPSRLRIGEAEALAMYQLSAPSFADGREDSSEHENAAAGFQHVARGRPLRAELRKGAKSVVPLADRAIAKACKTSDPRLLVQ